MALYWLTCPTSNHVCKPDTSKLEVKCWRLHIEWISAERLTRTSLCSSWSVQLNLGTCCSLLVLPWQMIRVQWPLHGGSISLKLNSLWQWLNTANSWSSLTHLLSGCSYMQFSVSGYIKSSLFEINCEFAPDALRPAHYSYPNIRKHANHGNVRNPLGLSKITKHNKSRFQ